MKQQLLRDRQTLIQHLQQKVNLLRQARNSLVNQQNQKKKQEEHINIGQYLNQQNIKVQPKKKAVVMSVPKKDNFVMPAEPVRTKADVIKEQKQTKQRLMQLQEMYKRKRQLERVGIHENDPSKIKGMYNNKQSRDKIYKKVEENKRKQAEKIEKDKIIKEQLQKVQSFLKEGKQGKKKSNYLPQKHYSKVIVDQRKLKVYQSLIKKNHLSLTQKQKLLECTFQVLKQARDLVLKETLKAFLLSNVELCDKFYITKNQIVRDLDVYATNQPDSLTYQQFYEFVKSIQITNKALKPNLGYKNNSKAQKSKEIKANIKRQTQNEEKQMQKYLKNLFSYFDTKYERVIERQRFEIALKKALLFDDKKYKSIKKSKLVEFGQHLVKQKSKNNKKSYYKTLDLKYIGLQEIIDTYKKFQTQPQAFIEQEHQNQIQQQQQDAFNEQEIDFSQKKAEKTDFQSEMPTKQLESVDFETYGWPKQQNRQQFQSLKKVDKYYKQIANKYGNEIHWNGFDHYKQDFTNFDKLIKQMNEEHQK